mgnify:CR=1 FL=1
MEIYAPDTEFTSKLPLQFNEMNYGYLIEPLIATIRDKGLIMSKLKWNTGHSTKEYPQWNWAGSVCQIILICRGGYLEIKDKCANTLCLSLANRNRSMRSLNIPIIHIISSWSRSVNYFISLNWWSESFPAYHVQEITLSHWIVEANHVQLITIRKLLFCSSSLEQTTAQIFIKFIKIAFNMYSCAIYTEYVYHEK